MNLTLALTHFNRYEMVLEAIAQVQDDPRIDEILIMDDASTDGSWEQLLEHFLAAGDRVSLYRNARNLDCYANKAQAVENARNPWVLLFDSDNVLAPEYLNALEAVGPRDPDTAYLPTFARPDFDYRAFASARVTRRNVAEYAARPQFTTALNTANYVVHRETYFNVWDPHVDPRTVDSLYMNLRWLETGHVLRFVEGMEYDHRMHDGSHFVQNHTRGDEQFGAQLRARLAEMR